MSERTIWAVREVGAIPVSLCNYKLNELGLINVCKPL